MSVCKRVIIVFVGVAVFFGFFGYSILSDILLDEGQTGIIWSVPVGIILGIAMCLYLSNSYDLKTGDPKNPDAPFASTDGLWGPPLGVLIANIISRFFGQFVVGFVIVVSGIWLLIVVGYLGFHSCRRETGEKSDQ